MSDGNIYGSLHTPDISLDSLRLCEMNFHQIYRNKLLFHERRPPLPLGALPEMTITVFMMMTAMRALLLCYFGNYDALYGVDC